MYLGSYSFEGDPTELTAGYERLIAHFPPETMDLHVCIRTDTGLTVMDACPSREVFEEFSASTDFHSVISACGLPEPKVQGLGTVHHARLRAPVTP